MKISALSILYSLSLYSSAQKHLVGLYRDHFFSRIELKADSTFKYTWHFDMTGSWTKGTWSFRDDTIYFRMIPTYDTVTDKNDVGNPVDKLILSVDETPERLTLEQYVGMALSSGGQNLQGYPEKLFPKKERLYKIYNGRLVVKKQNGLWAKEKWHPWFFKSDN